MSHNITIYTDGSSRGNPGPGGYGAILMSGTHRKEISQGFLKTTNNRMELLGVIAALESIKNAGADVTVFLILNMWSKALKKNGCLDGRKKTFKGKKIPTSGNDF